MNSNIPEKGKSRKESYSSEKTWSFSNAAESYTELSVEDFSTFEERDNSNPESRCQHSRNDDSPNIFSSTLSTIPLKTTWLLCPVLFEEMVSLRDEERMDCSGQNQSNSVVHQEGYAERGSMEKIVIFVNITTSKGKKTVM